LKTAYPAGKNELSRGVILLGKTQEKGPLLQLNAKGGESTMSGEIEGKCFAGQSKTFNA